MGPELDTWAQAGPEVLPEVHMDPKDPTPALHGHVLLGDADDRVVDGILQLAGLTARRRARTEGAKMASAPAPSARFA